MFDNLDQAVILDHFITLKCLQLVSHWRLELLYIELLSIHSCIHPLMHNLFLNLVLSMFQLLSSCLCIAAFNTLHVILFYCLWNHWSFILKLLDFEWLWRGHFRLFSLIFILLLLFLKIKLVVLVVIFYSAKVGTHLSQFH